MQTDQSINQRGSINQGLQMCIDELQSAVWRWKK